MKITLARILAVIGPLGLAACVASACLDGGPTWLRVVNGVIAAVLFVVLVLERWMAETLSEVRGEIVAGRAATR